ncbi:hypothetical protein LEMLEM_LOCUS22680 [Lemmus lemmus]
MRGMLPFPRIWRDLGFPEMWLNSFAKNPNENQIAEELERRLRG